MAYSFSSISISDITLDDDHVPQFLELIFIEFSIFFQPPILILIPQILSFPLTATPPSLLSKQNFTSMAHNSVIFPIHPIPSDLFFIYSPPHPALIPWFIILITLTKTPNSLAFCLSFIPFDRVLNWMNPDTYILYTFISVSLLEKSTKERRGIFKFMITTLLFTTKLPKGESALISSIPAHF